MTGDGVVGAGVVGAGVDSGDGSGRISRRRWIFQIPDEGLLGTHGDKRGWVARKTRGAQQDSEGEGRKGDRLTLGSSDCRRIVRCSEIGVSTRTAGHRR